MFSYDGGFAIVDNSTCIVQMYQWALKATELYSIILYHAKVLITSWAMMFFSLTFQCYQQVTLDSEPNLHTFVLCMNVNIHWNTRLSTHMLWLRTLPRHHVTHRVQNLTLWHPSSSWSSQFYKNMFHVVHQQSRFSLTILT